MASAISTVMAMALLGGSAKTTITIKKMTMTMAGKVAGAAARERGGHAGAATEAASALH